MSTTVLEKIIDLRRSQDILKSSEEALCGISNTIKFLTDGINAGIVSIDGSTVERLVAQQVLATDVLYCMKESICSAEEQLNVAIRACSEGAVTSALGYNANRNDNTVVEMIEARLGEAMAFEGVFLEIVGEIRNLTPVLVPE